MKPSSVMQPVYARVYDSIIDAIRSNLWMEGECIWSEAEICHRFSVSRITAMRALNELESNGIVRREKGIGSILISRSLDVQPELAVHIISAPDPHLHTPLSMGLLEHIQKCEVPVSYYSPSMLSSAIAWNQFMSLSRGFLILEGRNLDRQFRPYLSKCWNSFHAIIHVLTKSVERVYPYISVELDEVEGGRIQAQHAIDQGYARVVLYCFPGYINEQYFGQLTGIQGACASANVPLCIINKWTPELSDEEMQLQAQEVLDAAGKHGAILCDSDHRASFLIRAIQERGWTLGADIGLIGFYDTPWSRTLDLTSVSIPVQEVTAAVDCILENPRIGSQKITPVITNRASSLLAESRGKSAI